DAVPAGEDTSTRAGLPQPTAPPATTRARRARETPRARRARFVDIGREAGSMRSLLGSGAPWTSPAPVWFRRPWPRPVDAVAVGTGPAAVPARGVPAGSPSPLRGGQRPGHEHLPVLHPAG